MIKEGSPSGSVATPASAPPRTGRWVAVVVVVAVVAFLLGVFGSGLILPGHSSSNGNHSTPPPTVITDLTYREAAPLASAKANASGTGWAEVAGLGVDLGSPLSIASIGGLAGCDAPPLYVPAFAGPLTSGLAPFWLFYFAQNAGSFDPSLLLITVTNGTAATLVDFPSGSVCSTNEASLAVVPSGVLDSPGIVASAGAAGGTSFLAGDPEAGVLFEVAGSTTGAQWIVEYDPCGFLDYPGLVNGVLPQFTATYDADSGSLVSAATSSTTCVRDTPYTVALSPGAEGNYPSGVFYENFTVDISASLPVSYLAPEVEVPEGYELGTASDGCYTTEPSQCPMPAYGWYATLSLGGVIQETYPGAGTNPLGWIGIGASAQVTMTSGETLTILSESAFTGVGNQLYLVGQNGVLVTSVTSL